ncbi:MAG: ATP-binding protein [Legionella sp.]|nr:ATP-binding protein [Legionella sp.]
MDNNLPRNLASQIRELLAQFPAVVILGARQVGKTEIARHIAPDFVYVDLENPADRDRIEFDPGFFFEQHPSAVILDEAQEFPLLFNYLRGVIDNSREAVGRFIITGSSSPELLSYVSETLAGRVAIIELGTLKANEFYKKPLNNFYDIFNTTLDKNKLVFNTPEITLENMQMAWLKGGYPEPCLKALKDETFYERWMVNYQSTYLNRDLAKLFPKLDKINYRRFLTMLGKLSGTIINRSDLARALSISAPTVAHYLDIAEGTYLWRQLPSFERQISKNLVKMPKGHVRDSGLLHSLLGIYDLEQLLSDPVAGRSFEGFVIEEIIKGIQGAGIYGTEFSYYRTRSGAEIDLIIKGRFGMLPIEIKLGSAASRKQLTALSNFIEQNNLDFGLLINQSTKVEWLTKNILQLPVYYL